MSGGEISEAVLLVKLAISAAWFQRLAKRFLKCEADRQIKFIDQYGVEQPRLAHGNTFFYLGCNSNCLAEIFRQVGSISVPV